ncbi:MAG: hypothetical protein QM638_08240 [Nocardioides sp.]|uniref:hypothetical protein n=1 Tax=Nocardioides sp. TaxID=35761 RepID=UPI0039E45D28
MSQARDHLVRATRRLAAAVGRTDVDPVLMRVVAERIEESRRRSSRLVGVGLGCRAHSAR